MKVDIHEKDLERVKLSIYLYRCGQGEQQDNLEARREGHPWIGGADRGT